MVPRTAARGAVRLDAATCPVAYRSYKPRAVASLVENSRAGLNCAKCTAPSAVAGGINAETAMMSLLRDAASGYALSTERSWPGAGRANLCALPTVSGDQLIGNVIQVVADDVRLRPDFQEIVADSLYQRRFPAGRHGPKRVPCVARDKTEL